MTEPLPVPYLPGAEVPNSLAEAVQMNLEYIARVFLVSASVASRDLANNTAGNLTIGGALDSSASGGGGRLVTRGGGNVISFQWNSSSLDIYIDSTHVIRINTPSFPTTI